MRKTRNNKILILSIIGSFFVPTSLILAYPSNKSQPTSTPVQTTQSPSSSPELTDPNFKPAIEDIKNLINEVLETVPFNPLPVINMNLIKQPLEYLGLPQLFEEAESDKKNMINFDPSSISSQDIVSGLKDILSFFVKLLVSVFNIVVELLKSLLGAIK